jgi:hypothetical protein
MDRTDMAGQLAGICDYAGASVSFSIKGGVTLATPYVMTAIFSAPRHDTAAGETAFDTEYPTITAPTGKFAGVERGDLCTISGTSYSVIRLIPDGYLTTKAYLAYE